MNRNIQRQLAEERGVDIRMPSTALFGISSADRYKNVQERRSRPTFPFSFNITKNENILNGFFHRIALTEFRINWALPNIAGAWANNQIQATIAGQPPQIITLPDGFYTPQDMGDVLADLLDAAFPLYNWTIVTDKASGVMFITCVLIAGGAVQTISFQPLISGVYSGSPYRQLFDLLNFTYSTANLGTVPGLSVYSGTPVLRFTDFVDIVCEQLTAVQDVKDTSTSRSARDVIARIYFDIDMPSDATYENAILNTTFNAAVPPVQTGTTRAAQGYGARMNAVRPFIIYRQFQTPKQIKWLPNTPLGQVEFTLYDDQGRSINDMLYQVFNGNLQSSELAKRYAVACDWNATLLVSEN